MRDSDWLTQNLLRSDWLGPSVAPYTTVTRHLRSRCADKIKLKLIKVVNRLQNLTELLFTSFKCI